MTTTSHKPSLIFVHGAWHTPDSWDKVVQLMESQQYRRIRVKLPSVGSNQSTTFGEDVEVVRKAILSETSQSTNVVLVVHSYGGAVGSSALQGLTWPTRQAPESAKDSSGCVLGLIMLASFFIPTGSAFVEHLGGKPSSWWTPNPKSGLAVINTAPAHLFYNDLPPEEGEQWAKKLGTQSLSALMEGGKHAYAGWMDVPVWYLTCTEDNAVPVQAQRAFLQRAKDAGAAIKIREIGSGHSPMLSCPRQTVDFIAEACASLI